MLNAVLESTEETRVRIQLLGRLSIERGEDVLELPKSRKVRALIAYLALSPRGVSRSELCELLWDAPSDPRGELRWCLSRMRAVLDDESTKRVIAQAESVRLDPSDCDIDVLEVAAAVKNGIDALSTAQLVELLTHFQGDFLEGLHLSNSPLFDQWVGAERRRHRDRHLSVLRELVRRSPEDDVRRATYLESWLRVDPFDRVAHEALLRTLVVRGQLREAEEHLAATIRLFELEGLEWLPIREAWRNAKSRARTPVVEVRPSPTEPAPTLATPAKRSSICVMPFLETTASGMARNSLGDGLADDVITRLAKLRVLFVIARGTAFALGDRHLDAEEVGRILKVDYVVSGVVQRSAARVLVRVELVDTRKGGIVWADEFECAEADAHVALADIGSQLVASISEEVETVERNRAILKPPSSLDAWEAYHRGLWHMYRFNTSDNDRAEHFFRISAQLDPTFARAHAGLSFAHFQNAFLHRPQERAKYTDQAFDAAGQSLMADDRDPAAHWAMGRALWLRGDQADCLSELNRSVDLSPNFALGHYTLGFVESQSGDARGAIAAADHSRRLSPFDPLLFAMLATRALSHMRLGEYDDAATWALKAAARPNAHAHILAITVNALAAADRVDEARTFVARIRNVQHEYSVDDFLQAFRFPSDTQAFFRGVAHRIDFD